MPFADSDRVIRILADRIDFDGSILLETRIDEIDSWDSIAIVGIILALEKDFSVKVPIPVITQSEKVRDIVDYIQRHSEACPHDQ